MSTALDYDVRGFRPSDAAGISELVREVYGDGYGVHEELYHPDRITALNDGGELVSFVAIDPASRVVGHYALECSLLRVAETGEAMVSPDHRHHGLMERMRELVEAAAYRLRLAAIYGRCVTSHTFSQQSEERAGCRPCNLTLGLAPRTFHTVGQAPNQRMSTVTFAKLLTDHSAHALHAPQRHRAIVGKAYQQLGLSATFTEGRANDAAPTQIEVDARPDLGEASYRAPRIGADFADRLRRAVAEQTAGGKMEALFLDLPLSDPGAPDAAEAAESQGFFLAGVAPGGFADCDALCYQRLLVDLDVNLLQLAHPFALELRDYVAAERRRVGS